MDVERQNEQNKDAFSFTGLKEHVKEKAKQPTANATLVIFTILNIIMLIVGFVHLNDCPIRRMIPIYLIVGGAVGIVSKMLPFINRKLEITVITYIIYGLFIFEVIWMFLGSYWVYATKPTYNAKNSLYYCNKTAYQLAFWLLTVNWILIAITLVCIICAAVCVAFVGSKST